ncbi:MAG: acetolactate synthase large subunit, partial [Actinomycetia bacterium]|nr:acetolactate synthase large subunit [Actinomycetes bacterium]
IQMNIQELATIKENKLPIKIIILNNSYLGMVRQWQQLFYDRRYAYTDISVAPNFEKLGEAYGIPGYTISENKDLEKVLKEVLSSKEAAIVDIKIAKEENVFPMVPANSPLEKMITDEKGVLLT